MSDNFMVRELKKEGFKTFNPYLKRGIGARAKGLAAQGALRVIHRMSPRSAIRAIQSLPAEQCEVAFLVDFLTTRFMGLIRPSQVRSELTAFAIVVKELKPKTVLEIGTFKGGTLFLLSRLATPDATVVSVDLPGGLYGGGYPSWKTPVYQSFGRPGQKLHLVRANSHEPETVDKVRALFGNKNVDLLFIDADHTYEGVKRDYELYSPLVSENGMIAFHDIVPHPPELHCGVDIFWNEIKRSTSRELIENPKQGWAGIGIL